MTLSEDLEMPAEPVVLRPRGPRYRRWAANEYQDKKASLTPRQALFYRNLIHIAQLVGSNELPVDFETPSQGAFHLDHGCVKIAVHAGFLMPLRNDDAGVVSTVQLAWDVAGGREDRS